MTPKRLEEIQNRLDRGVSPPVDAYDLLKEVQRLSEEVAALKKKNLELENDLTDLAIDSSMVQSAISAWEDKFEHAQSSALTAAMIAAELKKENQELRALLGEK